MAVEVEYTDEFEEWWNQLDESEQESVEAVVQLLEEHGPHPELSTQFRNCLSKASPYA